MCGVNFREILGDHAAREGGWYVDVIPLIKADLQERNGFTAQITVPLQEFPIRLVATGRIDQPQSIRQLTFGCRSDKSHSGRQSANGEIVQTRSDGPGARVIA